MSVTAADQMHLLTIVAGRGGQPVGGCRCGWSGRAQYTTDAVVADYDHHLGGTGEGSKRSAPARGH
jgi:hypothetical protein